MAIFSTLTVKNCPISTNMLLDQPIIFDSEYTESSQQLSTIIFSLSQFTLDSSTKNRFFIKESEREKNCRVDSPVPSSSSHPYTIEVHFRGDRQWMSHSVNFFLVLCIGIELSFKLSPIYGNNT